MKSKHTESLLENLDLNSRGLNGKIWLGAKPKKNHNDQSTIIPTGYQSLDDALHLGGWPLHTSTELNLNSPGIGELRLLTPALRELANRNPLQANVIWVAPPFLPFAPALIKEHINVKTLTIVRTNTVQDTLWATEQALLSESCSAVFSWTGHHDLNIKELRRLQLAAEKTATWNVLFRDARCLKQASTSGLRIHLQTNNYSKIDLHILKQPQGWGGQRCTLSLHPHYENWQRIAVDLLPHRHQSQTPLKPKRKRQNKLTSRQSTVTVLSSFAALKIAH